MWPVAVEMPQSSSFVSGLMIYEASDGCDYLGSGEGGGLRMGQRPQTPCPHSQPGDGHLQPPLPPPLGMGDSNLFLILNGGGGGGMVEG
ncbi:hypothetical protein DPEC_G00116070 [Dallia pectoralis]|uniref:Uncharacterized protein n=1 Tax=Dallia pectoralis TaxID=75939 RepID=A0ACC2GUS6_DALPE|nr:hypothetical protein DPEC_G00116070 [Dallia pectoralis]